MRWFSIFGLTAAFGLNLSNSSMGIIQEQPPNIVVIFIDDMGYADVGPFHRWIQKEMETDEAISPATTLPYATPHLDALANSGRMFTSFIVPSAVCSASRSALMTGCLPERIGFRGALGPNAKTGIHANEMTLAELCKSQGYRTACFGKWHLGRPTEFLPLQHGFDEFYGIPYSNDMWPLHPAVLEDQKRDASTPSRYPQLPMLEGNEIVDSDVTELDQKEMTKEFTNRAVQFIEKSQDKPFLLYFPHAMVHVPLYSSPNFEGQSGAGPFGDAVQEIDWSVGEIIATLEKHNLSERTLVIFSSDNGPWLSYGSHAGSAGPLREGKGTSWEGGIRVPMIAKWPGRIPANSQVNTLASTIDIFPTVAALIDAPLPSHPIDGIDIAPLLFQKEPVREQISEQHTNQQSSDQYASDQLRKFETRTIPIYFGDGELQAIRSTHGKIVFPHNYRTLGTAQKGDAQDSEAQFPHDGTPVPYTVERITSPEYFQFGPSLKQQVERSSLTPEMIENSTPETQEHYKYLLQSAQHWRSTLGDKLQNQTGQEVRPIGRID